MSSAIDAARRKLCGRRGQSSVEAAFALPVLLLLVLLLLQPGIVLYDRIVMQGAAAEGCRLLATTSDGAAIGEDFIRRRLGAIPELDQFHVHSGGCTWRIELSGDESSDVTSVRLATEVRPLPLLDGAMALLGMTNAGGNLVLSVECEQQVQPDWISGVADGRDPGGWVGI